MRFVKKLPKKAIYDYTDIYGSKHYHLLSRYYIVFSDRIVSETEYESINLIGLFALLS